jgi:DNA-binding Lrp family transcriptional regulator
MAARVLKAALSAVGKLSRIQKAFILLKVEPGNEKKVIDDLLKIEEVKVVHVIPGEWDLLAEVEAEKEIVVPSDQKVYNVVMDKVGKLKHVQDTNTMVSQFSKSK